MPTMLNMCMYIGKNWKEINKMQTDVRKYCSAFGECSVMNILPF